MLEYPTPTVVTFLASLFFFYLIGEREKNKLKSGHDFWFSRNRLTSSSIAWSISTTNISFGFFIFFFMLIAPIYGWGILAGSMAGWISGLILIRNLVKSGESIDIERYDSMGAYVYAKTKSQKLQVMVDVSNIILIVGLLIAELSIAGSLFSMWAPSDQPIYALAGSIFILFIAFLYILYGGFGAVIASDRWQGILAIIAMCLIVLSASSFLFSLEGLSFPTLTPQVDMNEVLAYIGFSFIVNFFYSLPQLAIWHRISSGDTVDGKSLGLRNAIIVIFSFYIVCVLIGSVLAANGSPIVSARSIFTLTGSLGELGALIVVPLMFTGIVASTISTVDSYALSFPLTIRGWRNVSREKIDTSSSPETLTMHPIDSSKLPRERFLAGLGIFLLFSFVMFALYLVFNSDESFARNFRSICFAFVSQIIVGGPLILFLMKGNTLHNEKVLVWGLFGSWLVVTGTGIMTIVFSSDLIQFTGVAVGVLVGWIACKTAFEDTTWWL